MRVLVTSWAWTTHYTPLVPLIWALQAAGHEVRVASQPALTGVITGSGATAVPVGADLDHDEVRARTMRDLRFTEVPQAPPPGVSMDDWDPAEVARVGRVFGVFVAYAEAMAADLLDFARAWRPDLIVFDPTTYAGPIVAAALGIPAVRHIHGVDVTYQARQVLPPLLAPLADRLGVDLPDLLGEATIDPCPPSMQTPADVDRVLVRYVPYNGPACLPGWLRTDRPGPSRRICVTWGTSTTRLGGAAMFVPPQVIAAAQDMDVEIVLCLAEHDAAAIGPLPPRARVAGTLPLHLLLPTCAALVHQGGNGTLLTGALYGVPQLVLPQLPDQAFHTRMLTGSGAAIGLPPGEAAGEAGAARLRDGLERLLTGADHAAAAARLRTEMHSMPTPAQAVADLERRAGQNTPRTHARA